MESFEVVQEDANIVVVGNFNPKIFHPEWFIAKGIIGQWAYEADDLICVADYTRFEMPDNILLEVYLTKLIIRTNAQTSFVTIRDLLVNIFSYLSETPTQQVGMNFSTLIKIKDKEQWKILGENIAPQQKWKAAADYYEGLGDKEKYKFGLWELVMNLPRPDDYLGYIRAKIKVANDISGIIEFSINNHIDIVEQNAKDLTEVLNTSWEASLEFANKYTQRVLTENLVK